MHRVLDLCSGDGEVTQSLQACTDDFVVAFDIKKTSQRGCTNENEVCGDAHSLPFKNESFNEVILEMPLGIDDIRQVIYEVQRVLKQNGLFYIITEKPDFLREVSRIEKKMKIISTKKRLDIPMSNLASKAETLGIAFNPLSHLCFREYQKTS